MRRSRTAAPSGSALTRTRHTTNSHPNSGINPATTLPYRLPTTVTVSALEPGSGTEEPISRTLTGYDPVVSGDTSGWELGQATRTTTDANPAGPRNDLTGDVVKVSRFDSEGRVVDSRQPNSTGADAGTTKTVYYTAAANSGSPECGSKAQWAGLTCKTFPAAAPLAGSTATPTLPTTTTTSYSYLLAPKTVVEKSGAATRTTTTNYQLDGRVQSTATVVTGLTGSTPNTEKSTTYDAATGQQTVVTAKAADNTTTKVTTGYDSWGRQVSYQPQGDVVTTTVYNASGQVATVTDAIGSTLYTYDGTDAAGRMERRGLATKVEVTSAGSTWTSSGAYDAGGSITIQKLPGGVTKSTDYDNAGEPIGLRYTGQVTNLNEDGSTTVDPNGPWLSWSVDNDVSGRIVHEWTPDGTAFTGSVGDAPGDAIGYDRAFRYDNLGRLTTVKDRTAATTGVDVTEQLPGCTTRTYGFDRNDNRLTKSTAGPAADGSCTTTGTTTTRAFDTADRPSTAGYVYDLLGRTTTLPAADAPDPAGGNIVIGYYDNDLARSIAQAGTTTTFTLDALDRRSVETVTTGTTSTQTTRHYTDTSDNPAWVTQGITTQRYAELIGGDLSLTVEQTGKATLPIANPHGDVVTSVALTGTDPAASIGEWCNYDEYGIAGRQPVDRADHLWLARRETAGDLRCRTVVDGSPALQPRNRPLRQHRPGRRRRRQRLRLPDRPDQPVRPDRPVVEMEAEIMGPDGLSGHPVDIPLRCPVSVARGLGRRPPDGHEHRPPMQETAWNDDLLAPTPVPVRTGRNDLGRRLHHQLQLSQLVGQENAPREGAPDSVEARRTLLCGALRDAEGRRLQEPLGEGRRLLPRRLQLLVR